MWPTTLNLRAHGSSACSEQVLCPSGSGQGLEEVREMEWHADRFGRSFASSRLALRTVILGDPPPGKYRLMRTALASRLRDDQARSREDMETGSRPPPGHGGDARDCTDSRLHGLFDTAMRGQRRGSTSISIVSAWYSEAGWTTTGSAGQGTIDSVITLAPLEADASRDMPNHAGPSVGGTRARRARPARGHRKRHLIAREGSSPRALDELGRPRGFSHTAAA